jgi:nucleotide-binding universal stress UspA family protein
VNPDRVVVGVDFSDAALAAARWVANHFAPGAELVLVHIVPRPAMPPYVPPDLVPSQDDAPAVSSTLFRRLRTIAADIAPGRTRVRLASGAPAESLVRVATELGAGMICVGRGRHRRGSARFGGTTSQRLLARSHLPTLVVPGGPLAAPSVVLAAVTEGAGTRRTLGVATGVAAALAAHLDALHVIERELLDHVASHDMFRASESAPYGAWVTPDGPGAWLRRRAQEWMVSELHAAGVGPHGASASVQSGDAGQLILRRAHDVRAGLIVIGRGGPPAASLASDRVPVGSTARMVAWASPCPILVVPPEPHHTAPHIVRGSRAALQRAAPVPRAGHSNGAA